MPELLIKDVEPDVLGKLSLKAAKNGRNLEAEIRSILSDAVVDNSVSRSELGRRVRTSRSSIQTTDSVYLL